MYAGAAGYVEREYGAVFNPETMELDWKATNAARERMRQARAAGTAAGQVPSGGG